MINKNQASQMGINIIQSEQENNALFNTLKTKFPQTIKDGQVSLNAIKMLLGLNESASNASGYELTFTGKGLANALYSTPCQKLLKLQESFTPQTLPTSPNKHPKNAIIVGDNLDALKLLKAAYSEKIKMIYIDPPYNTTNENFIYPDNFRQDYKKILEEVGLIEIDENGEEFESEDLKFFKNIQGSRTHSGWLSFMLPRLKLARDLLKEDGVIFISIDDNEQANLKLLCDEIFGEDNFVANFIIQHNPRGRSLDKTLAQTHEYCICYCKDITAINPFLIAKNEDGIAEYNKSDENGLYREMRLMNGNRNFTRNERPNLYFPLYVNVKTNKVATQKSDEFTQEVLPINSFGSEQCWTWSKTKIEKENNLIVARKNSNSEWRIFRKDYLNDTSSFTKTKTLLIDKIFNNENGTETIRKLFGIDIFSTPKPVEMIIYLLKLITLPNNDDIVLDFFAGSGTTAQAVMELNAEDNGNRQCILVQLDEAIDSTKSKVAYDFCKKELKSENPVISDITIERVKRAAQKIILNTQTTTSGNLNLDLGFKVYNLQDKAQITNTQNQITLFNHSNLTPFDKALNLALQSGKTLSNALETIIQDKLYKCEDAYFCVDLGEDVLECLAKTKNEMIFLDGYEDIDLQAFLNLNASFKERLSVVY